MEQRQEYSIKIPEFSGANVSIKIASEVMKKDQQFIRQGLIQGILPFGVAFKKEGSTQYDYYISPLEFWKFTGYIFKGGDSING